MSATLTTVHQAIIDKLTEKFSHKVDDIRVYSPLTDDVKNTALLLSLEHMTETKGDGDGRTVVQCNFAVYAMLPTKGIPPDKVSIAAANYASELIDFIRYNRWGLGKDITKPEDISAQPAQFKPGSSGYESWVVMWEQKVHLGEIEQDHSIPVTSVFANNGDEGDYDKLV